MEHLKKAEANYEVAVVYGELGMMDEAFEWLERDIRARKETVIFLKVDPLRSDPRFPPLLEQLGLSS